MEEFTVKLIAGVAQGLLEAIVLGLLLWNVRPHAAVVGSTRLLAYGLPMKGFVCFFWIFWLVLLTGVLVSWEEDYFLPASVLSGMFLVALLFHAEIFGVRVLFDSTGIRTRSPWRRSRQIPWSSIVRARFDEAMQWYVLETKGYGRVRLPVLLSGIESLLQELEQRGVPVARQAAA